MLWKYIRIGLHRCLLHFQMNVMSSVGLCIARAKFWVGKFRITLRLEMPFWQNQKGGSFGIGFLSALGCCEVKICFMMLMGLFKMLLGYFCGYSVLEELLCFLAAASWYLIFFPICRVYGYRADWRIIVHESRNLWEHVWTLIISIKFCTCCVYVQLI